jgi:putative tryptophan/tyrosine transport system substrate-binding protein
MNRRDFCRDTLALALAGAGPAAAQAAPRLTVAWMSTDNQEAPSPNLAAFRDGMRELGYVEGRNLRLVAFWGDGSAERVRAVVPGMLGARPDVIVAAGGLALFALIAAGVRLPVVFSMSADPVEAKIVESFARPGGNLTGISLFTLALVGKRLELVKEVLPKARRIAVIANSQHPGERKELEVAQAAAQKLGLAVRYFPVTSAAELDAALADVARQRDDAVLAFADGFVQGYAGRFAAFAQANRIPTIDGWAPFAEAGNLMIYGPVIADVYHRLAGYVDRIGRGAKPADLPIELPTKVELVVNVKVARAIGITLPASVLARADRVISS